MKFLLIVSLGLLALSAPALSWESWQQQEDDQDYPVYGQEGPDREGLTQQEEGFDYGYPVQDTLPVEAVEEELRKMQVEVANGADNHWEEDAMLEQTGGVLRSGGTVQLQFPECSRWLSCRDSQCSSSPTECAAVRFRIFRALGSGPILTGDFVGFYYIYRGPSWFSMKRGIGQTDTCPRSPSNSDGFNTCSKWHTCRTDVFQIYARGKRLGAGITGSDTIALYYPGVRRSGFVQYNGNSDSVGLSQCLLQNSNNLRPPTRAAFNNCKAGNFGIKIID